MAPSEALVFDPTKYKAATHDQWQHAAAAWNRWSPTIAGWLDAATETMLDLAGVRPGSRVLNLAAGAGEETLLIARWVEPDGWVLATDISSNLVALAETNAQQAGFINVEARVMDGEDLSQVESDSFDAVLSRVGLIYFPNRDKALSEMYRVLKVGGMIGAIVYSTADNNRFFSVPVSIIRRRAQLPPPLAGQPGPFSLGSPETLEAAYQRAGFRDVMVTAVSAPLRMSSAADCVRFQQESFGALHQMLSGLSDNEREAAWEEVEHELQQFEGPDGFVGPCELLIAVGTK